MGTSTTERRRLPVTTAPPSFSSKHSGGPLHAEGGGAVVTERLGEKRVHVLVHSCLPISAAGTVERCVLVGRHSAVYKNGPVSPSQMQRGERHSSADRRDKPG